MLAASLAPAAPATPRPQTMPDTVSPLVRQVIADTDWLSGYPTRVVGTPGHDAASAALGARLQKYAAAPGVQIWTHEYQMVMPQTLLGRMTLLRGPATRPEAAADAQAIYPIWPALVRANTTPRDGIEGELIYVGEGDYPDMLPRSLKGQIAVMEMNSGNRWQLASNLGARAILLLGTPAAQTRDAVAQLTRVPLNVPRFYLPDGPRADALRAELTPIANSLRKNEDVSAENKSHGIAIPGLRARLTCNVQFRPVTARNFYVLVKPRDAAGTLPAAIAIAAAYDSMSVVPDLAPGADAAVDAAVTLSLLGRCVENRPARPVLFAFVDAFTANQVGVRAMLAALATREKDRQYYVRQDENTCREYDDHAALVNELGRGSAGQDRIWQRKYYELHRYVKDEVARQVVRINDELGPMRLLASKLEGEEGKAAEARAAALDADLQGFYGAQNQLLTDAPTKPETAARAQAVWDAVCDRVLGQAADAKARLAVHEQRRGLRRELVRALHRDPADWTMDECRALVKANKLREPKGDLDAWRTFCATKMDDRNIDQNTIAFLLGVDLSDAGVTVGPRLFCAFQRLNETGNAKQFMNWLKPLGENGLWTGLEAAVADLSPLAGSTAQEQFSVGPAANVSSVAVSWGVPAMTWGTLNGVRTRVDTPYDTAAALNWRRLAPQADATATLVDRLINHTDFAPNPTTQLWSRACGVVVDQSPGEPVPRVPMPGYLTTLVNGGCRGGQLYFSWRAFAEGMRMDEYVLTGTDGMFFFDNLPGNAMGGRESYAGWVIQSYQLTDDGDIVRAVDLNKVGKGVRLDVNFTEKNANPRRALVFSCRQINVVGLIDPRFLVGLPYGSLLDAHRAGRPQRMNFSLFDGQMNAFLESQAGMRWQMLLRAGATDNRMILVNMVDPEKARGMSARDTMKGFALGEPLPKSPMEVAADDFYKLDARRIEDYAEKGLKSKTVNDIHDATTTLLDKAADARQRNDGLALFAASSGALSNEVRSYQAVRELANDVVRAAIFLLLALVPFSFAMERLLFASPHVYRQLGGITAIFTVMTAVLWSFHPAFRISTQPLMIIMAFGIIFMSLLVISIVYQKFKSQLEEMRSGRAESSGARSSKSGLAASAVRLGIANMRKRRLRTALTGTTVMLITFALLCFTSVSSYSRHKERTLSTTSPYTGLLIRQPQSRAMTPISLSVVKAAIGDRGEMVPLYWWCVPTSPDWRLRVGTLPRPVGPATRPDRWVRTDIALNGALGLSAGEEKLTGVDKILPQWQRFAEGKGCYLAQDRA
ncbi:MAG: hypothetical protein PHU85_07580, partial [Phycisphaerae bacterium]|nr:hypothetical protein [Phycisphaerae bacterium]